MAKDDEARKPTAAEELAALRQENAALKARIAELEPTREPSRPRTFVMSEGIRDELERHGKATDPATGDRWEKTGDTVTVTDRDGNTRTL